tara:strand:- start:327 stop:530 length:204 start_codon:yes stop_codon:yes gene_type:complete
MAHFIKLTLMDDKIGDTIFNLDKVVHAENVINSKGKLKGSILYMSNGRHIHVKENVSDILNQQNQTS